MALVVTLTLANTIEEQKDKINEIIGFVNAELISDVLATLTTTDKSSLVAAINEVNAKQIPFFLADGTQSNIDLV